MGHTQLCRECLSKTRLSSAWRAAYNNHATVLTELQAQAQYLSVGGGCRGCRRGLHLHRCTHPMRCHLHVVYRHALRKRDVVWKSDLHSPAQVNMYYLGEVGSMWLCFCGQCAPPLQNASTMRAQPQQPRRAAHPRAPPGATPARCGAGKGQLGGHPPVAAVALAEQQLQPPG